MCSHEKGVFADQGVQRSRLIHVKLECGIYMESETLNTIQERTQEATEVATFPQHQRMRDFDHHVFLKTSRSSVDLVCTATKHAAFDYNVGTIHLK